MKVRNQEFNGDDIELDGNAFEGCIFRKCRMQYRGKAGVVLVECVFEDVEWSFQDAAQITAGFLRVLTDTTGDYGRSLLVNSFPCLREWLKPEHYEKLAAVDGRNE